MVFGQPVENEDGLKASEIMDKIRSVWNNYQYDEVMIVMFMGMLVDHPRSICQRTMTETLKLIIALQYQEGQNEIPDYNDDWKGYSYEQLAKLFDRSKASIFQAIHEKGDQARRILEDEQIKDEVHKIALAELIKEEKQRIQLEESKENEQTNEQPVIPVRRRTTR